MEWFIPPIDRKRKVVKSTQIIRVPTSELSYGNGVTQRQAKGAFEQGFRESARRRKEYYEKRGIRKFRFVYYREPKIF